jgi:ABC-type nitrate/sulfonate/bicarbonate transport system substrate-binding protein
VWEPSEEDLAQFANIDLPVMLTTSGADLMNTYDQANNHILTHLQGLVNQMLMINELPEVEFDFDQYPIAGFKADLFDSVWAFEGWAGQNAAVQGYDVDYFSFVSINEVFDYYTPVIVANIEYAEAHPDIMKAFLRGAKKGYEYCIEHVDEAADILLEAAPEIDARLAHASQAYLADQYVADAPSWGVFDGERWSAFYEWLSKNTEMGAGIDVNAGWTNDYLA